MACSLTGAPVCHCKTKVIIYKPTHQTTLRKLFTDHAVYTSEYIIACLNHSLIAKSILERLLQNQKEIGEYFTMNYNKRLGASLTQILTQHIQLAGAAIKDLDEGKEVDMESIKNNVELFATVLHKNTKVPYDNWYVEFMHHNELVLELATLHIESKFQERVNKYDEYYNHMLHFSDMLFHALLDC